MLKTMSGAQTTPANVGMVSPEAEFLSLIITRPEDSADCPFWIGLYKKGEAGAREVFGLERIDDVFKLLTEQGIDEKQALMLSDSSGEVVRQFYLVPEVLCMSDRQEAKTLILKTVDALKPTRIGVYFGIDMKNPDSSRVLLEEILIGLARTEIRELFLFTGNLGVNTVLNAALRVKHGLAGSKELQVFH
ncbi:MAG TPA: hypothetical protein VE954_26785 [Oligoflexus sp.]|uniref:hypothetical protein n=1 Tax=Oligoflexus sp. TaxID=1971216 RepID=UPI002D743AEF|nr:hypothetical protein [Oligoflexus sp.]HYX36732.1 hypothetical protein [Oligoflexus sp.]